MSDLRFHPNMPLPVSVRATICHVVPQRVIGIAESTNKNLFVLERQNWQMYVQPSSSDVLLLYFQFANDDV